jgi:hypothetical protein
MTAWWQRILFMPKYVTQDRFDSAMRAINVLFDKIDVRFNHIDNRFNRLHTRLETEFVTKDDFHTRMDKMMTILLRLDQELTFEQEWKRRMESEITLIKQHQN